MCDINILIYYQTNRIHIIMIFECMYGHFIVAEEYEVPLYGHGYDNDIHP